MGRFTRRHFIRSAGLGALSIPFVQALMHGRAAARTGNVPVRFLGVRTYHGTDRNLFIPRQAGGAAPSGTDMALSELTFEYDNAFLSPLQAWRDRITVLDGIDQWACCRR